MAKLRWIRSYGTLKFDTPDGDLDLNDYAVHPSGGYCVRRHPKNNFMHSRVDVLDPAVHTNEVAILEGEVAYYHEFELANGRLLRLPTNASDYAAKCQTKGVIPEKEMTQTEQDTESAKQDAFQARVDPEEVKQVRDVTRPKLN